MSLREISSDDTALAPRLGTVQETLLTPLCARAEQCGRADGIVDDPTAAAMVKAIHYDFAKIRRHPNTLVGCAIRAARFDRRLQTFLQGPSNTGTEHLADQQHAIVLIGEGLDTTFERNDDGRCLWFEIDFPDVIELRKRFFQPDQRRHLIAGNVFDPEWVSIVRSSGAKRILFQLAGVLMYLEPEQVKALFGILANEFPGAEIVFDTCSQLAKRNSHRWEATVRTTSAVYRWGIDDARNVNYLDPRVHVTDVEYMLDFHRQQWTTSTRFWSWIYPPLRRSYQLNHAVIGLNQTS